MGSTTKKIAAGVALAAVAGLGAVEAQVPAYEGRDNLIKDEQSAASFRRFLDERYDYMTANQKQIGIPDESISKASYAKDEFEDYLLRKKYTDSKGGEIHPNPKGIIRPAIERVSRIQVVQRAYAYLFGEEDFESCGSIPCTFDSNDSYDSGNFALDATSKVNGTDSARCDIDGDASGCLLTKSLTNSTERWFQFSVFFPTGWSHGPSGYMTLFAITDTGGGAPAYFNVDDYGSLRLTTAGDELGYTNTGIDIPLNTITKLEFRVKVSATTGDVDVWINNDTEGSPDYNGSGSLNTGTQSINGFYLGGWNPDTVDDRYYDDVIVDSAFIGAGAAPPAADTAYESEWFF